MSNNEQPATEDGALEQVTLYSVPWCGWCQDARAWLERRGLAFEEIRVPDSQPERAQVIEVSGQMEVPVIVVHRDGRPHVFLDENDPELHALLGL